MKSVFNYFIITIAVLFLTPVILSVMLQVATMAMVASAIGPVGYGLWSSEPEPVSTPWKVINLDRKMMRSQAYNALVNRSQLTEDRTISVKIILPVDELRENNGMIVAREIRDAVAAGYVSLLASEECALLRQYIADKCILSSSNTRLLDDQAYIVSMTLRFTQRDAIGEIRDDGVYAFLENRFLLNGGNGMLTSRLLQG